MLLQAFKKISLRPERKDDKRYYDKPLAEAGSKKRDKDNNNNQYRSARCFNCYKAGHIAKDCKQPKRERGSCFKCDEMGHLAPECTSVERKKEKEVYNIECSVEGDEFRRNIIIRISDKSIVYVLPLIALLDSGSPISFIKKKLVKDCEIKSVSGFVQQLSGINNSKLIVLGTINAEITLNGVTKSNVALIIVQIIRCSPISC